MAMRRRGRVPLSMRHGRTRQKRSRYRASNDTFEAALQRLIEDRSDECWRDSETDESDVSLPPLFSGGSPRSMDDDDDKIHEPDTNAYEIDKDGNVKK
jgi:hypothetical protein